MLNPLFQGTETDRLSTTTTITSDTLAIISIVRLSRHWPHINNEPKTGGLTEDKPLIRFFFFFLTTNLLKPPEILHQPGLKSESHLTHNLC